MAVKMTVNMRKRKSNSMRLPTAVRIAEITSKRLQFFKIFWGTMPPDPPYDHGTCGAMLWAFGPQKIWTPTFKILAKILLLHNVAELKYKTITSLFV